MMFKKPLATLLSLATFAALASPGHAALINGLQLYYDFEGDTLTNGGISDRSGNSRDGSPIGVADATLGYSFTSDTPTALTGSLVSIRADGGDEIRADTPNYAGITGSSSRTVSMWVKVDPNVANSVNMHLIEWGVNNAGERFTVRREQGTGANQQGGLRTEIQTDFRTSAAGSPSLNDDIWHHVASVYDNSGGTKLEQVTMYFDGTPIASYVDGGASVDFATANATVLVGGSTLADRRWNGWMDDVAIWGRALSPAEVTALANGAPIIPEPSSSLALFGLATALVAMRRHRRN